MMTLEGVNPQMIANNLKPFQPTHPGEVLKDELEYVEFRNADWPRRWAFPTQLSTKC